VRPAGPDDLPKDLEAIIINTQRHNLEQLFIARHVRRLKQEGYTQAQIGRLIHRSEGALSANFAVLDCDDLVAAIEDENLQFGSARALAALPLADRQSLLQKIRRIAADEQKLPSIRRVEELVRQRQGATQPPRPPIPPLPPSFFATHSLHFPPSRFPPPSHNHVRVRATILDWSSKRFDLP
jgi:hypothetical protein